MLNIKSATKSPYTVSLDDDRIIVTVNRTGRIYPAAVDASLVEALSVSAPGLEISEMINEYKAHVLDADNSITQLTSAMTATTRELNAVKEENAVLKARLQKGLEMYKGVAKDLADIKVSMTKSVKPASEPAQVIHTTGAGKVTVTAVAKKKEVTHICQCCGRSNVNSNQAKYALSHPEKMPEGYKGKILCWDCQRIEVKADAAKKNAERMAVQ